MHLFRWSKLYQASSFCLNELVLFIGRLVEEMKYLLIPFNIVIYLPYKKNHVHNIFYKDFIKPAYTF
jgi:hypothetical protein